MFWNGSWVSQCVEDILYVLPGAVKEQCLSLKILFDAFSFKNELKGAFPTPPSWSNPSWVASAVERTVIFGTFPLGDYWRLVFILVASCNILLFALKTYFSVFTHACCNNNKTNPIICYRQPQAAQQTLQLLFLRLGLPSTLIRHENGASRKRSSKRRNLETSAFLFRVEGRKTFWKKNFVIIMWFPCPSFRHGWTQIQMSRSVIVAFSNYSGVDGKHLMRFQSNTSVFKYLRCSLNGRHLMLFQSNTTVFKFPRCCVDKTFDAFSD